MEDRVLIQKVVGKSRTRYVFKPLGFIADFAGRCRGVPDLLYHNERKYWSAPASAKTLHTLFDVFGKDRVEWTFGLEGGGTNAAAPATHPPLPPHWADRLVRTEDQLRVQRYSWRTVKSYLSHLRGFFHARRALRPEEVTVEVVRRYILERSRRGNFAGSTQGQLLNAIKFWMERVEGQDKVFVDLRPRKEQKLPQVLSVQEVRRLLGAVDNLKHRLILKTIYGCGLRLGEACRLQVRDINLDRREVFIRCAKGKKDRYVSFPDSLTRDLEEYRHRYAPDRWLFEGQHGGAYSERSVQHILRRAVDKSGVNPLATVHTLRHSYATHLIERGVSTRHIQELLGHASSRTTEIYTHISSRERHRVGSPLDDL